MTQFTFENGDTVVLGSGELAADDFNDAPHVLTDDRVWLQGHKLPPGVKPNYPVEINRDHPLAEGLTSYMVHAPRAHDLVIGHSPAVYEGTITQEAGFPYFDGTASVEYPEVPQHKMAAGDFSIFTKVRLDATTAEYQVCGTGNVDSSQKGWNLFRHGTNTDFIFAYWDGSSPSPTLRDTTDIIDDGEWHTVGVVWTNDNSRRELWIDGVIVDSDSGETNAGQERANGVVVGARHYAPGNYQKYWDGAIDDILIWEKALLPSDMESLSRDPYQILKPVGPSDQQIITPTPTADDRVWLI